MYDYPSCGFFEVFNGIFAGMTRTEVPELSGGFRLLRSGGKL